MNETSTTQAKKILQLLRDLPPRQRLRVIVQVLPEVERDLESEGAVTTSQDQRANAEVDLDQALLKSGLLTEIPDPLSEADRELCAPIEIQGKPLSEIIIEERR